ncbi:MAG TPA: hypothetical protein VEJ67_09720 [Candidatus Cybelea sp.]|nr:hypothetical protein [Candidatus Cybelea sp.]
MRLDSCLHSEAAASTDSLRDPRGRWRSVRWPLIVATALVLLALGPRVAAQTDPSDSANDSPKPIPLFSAGMGFVTPFEGGQPHLDPLVSPVFLVPLGDHWLVESRDTFESDLSTPPGSDAFHGVVEKEVDYLQLDYVANPYLTVTVGRYLTPFGIFNERLYPIWIRNLQTDPLILSIGTGPSGAGTGAMARGGFPLSPKVNVNYAAYYSTQINQSPVDSYRAAGGRAGLFFPGPRLEIGTSFQRLLQDEHSNAFGFHFEWQPPAIPLDVRSEYARSYLGSGYWIESGYFLSQIRKAQDEFRKVQLVGRMQQYFVPPTYGPGPYGDSDWSVPWWNTQEFDFGLNYYFRYNLRFVSSYGRQFSSWGNENIWTLGLTYRFVVPLGPGEMK